MNYGGHAPSIPKIKEAMIILIEKGKEEKHDELILWTVTRLATVVATKSIPVLISRLNQIYNPSLPKIL